MNWLKGKKTYIVAVAFVVLVVLPVVAGIVVPEYVYGILGALGLAALRAAVADVSGNKGWKTYVAAGMVAVLSVLQSLGVTLPVDPELIYAVLGAAGISGVRDAVGKIK